MTDDDTDDLDAYELAAILAETTRRLSAFAAEYGPPPGFVYDGPPLPGGAP